jgi:hypothetical protein
MMVKLSLQNQNAPVDLDLPKNEVILALAARGWNRAGCTREPGPEKPGRAHFF